MDATQNRTTGTGVTPPPRKGRRSPLPMLLGLLVLFVALAVVFADPLGWRTPDEAELDAKDPSRRALVALKQDEIRAVEIDAKDDEPFRLEEDGAEWWLERGELRYRADTERVELLLADLAELRSESLATDKPDAYATFEVDDDAATVVSVYAEGDAPAARLHVGKSAPGFTAAFVRLDGGKEVYRAGRNVRTQVEQSFKDFRNRRPWAFAPETVTELTVRPPAEDGSAKAEGALKFSKDGSIWKHDGANAGQNALTELLKKLSDLDTSQFADDATPEQTKLAGRTPNIEVVTPERRYALTLGAKGESDWYVADQDGVVYQFGDYKLSFYRELDFSRLTFDDTPKDPPAEGAEADGADADAAGNADAATDAGKQPEGTTP